MIRVQYISVKTDVKSLCLEIRPEDYVYNQDIDTIIDALVSVYSKERLLQAVKELENE